MCPTYPTNNANRFFKNRDKGAVLVVEVKSEPRYQHARYEQNTRFALCNNIRQKLLCRDVGRSLFK